MVVQVNVFLISVFFGLNLFSFESLLRANDANGRLGLDDAKKYAVEHNREVLALRHAVSEARAKSRKLTANYLPRVGVAGGVENESTSESDDVERIGYGYVNFNLFRGFEDYYRREIADVETEKAEISLSQAEFIAGIEVERFFHGFLFAKGSLGIKEEALKLNSEHAASAKNLRAAGLGSEADLQEFELRDALLRSEIVSLEQDVEEARIGLRKTLGEEIGSKIEPVGGLQHQHIKGKLMDYLERIKSSNPPLRLNARDLRIAEVESKMWRSQWLPKIDFEARAGYLPMDERNETFNPVSNQIEKEDATQVNLLLIAKMDLFSGLESVWQRQETASKRMRFEEDLKATLVNTISEVERFFRRIKSIEERVDLEEKNEDRAKKYYAAVLAEYRRGAKNSADLKAAADLMYGARIRREEYKYQFLLQRLEMEKLLGSPVDLEIITEE